MEERINDIEIHLMHQSALLEELNDVVIHQQQAIDRLTAEVALLKGQLQVVAPSMTRSLEEEEPPPHY